MAGSTYSTNLKIELMTTGENSGTWGDITNTNLGTALEQAVVGYGNPDYVSDANLTISITNSNAAQPARALVLNVTSTFGSLTATRELVVPTIQKQYIVQNNTTGGQSITVKTSAGTGITVPNGRKAHLYVNGTDVIQMFDFVDINGGTIDGTAIGASSASTGAFTTLNASGATTLDGNVTLGNASGDTVTVTGTISSNLLFTDNTYDIGASGATRPRNLFLAGAATIGGNLSVGGTLTLTGGVNLNGNVTVGDSAADTLTINSTVTSNLIFTDNTYDIGASGATRPRNLFIAGNITAGGSQTLTGALTVDSTTDSSSTTTGSIQTDGGVGIAKKLFVGLDANIYGLTVGRGAGAVSTNTAVGLSVLANGSNTGVDLVAIGRLALTANSSGGYSVAVGSQASYANTTGNNNTSVGYASLYANTTGGSNVAVGGSALYSNTTASFNTAVGYQAAYSNTTGAGIAAFGYQAAYATTGNNNAAFGNSAARNTTTGVENVAIGTNALITNTTGSYNTALGKDSLQANTTASNNTAVGYQAGYANTTGAFLAALGYQAAYSNTTGLALTAIGHSAAQLNTTGNDNTAVGYLAMQVNTTGANNSAFGSNALIANTTGSTNTAIGREALLANTTASSNTAVGQAALFSNTTTSNNTAVGYQAGYSNTTGTITAFGDSALRSNTTGAVNSAFGRNAAFNITTGTSNTAVGSGASGVYAALQETTTGNYNTAVGTQSLAQNIGGSNNTAIGYGALYVNKASNNTAVGYNVASAITTGSYNVVMGGNDSGSQPTFGANTTGAQNVAIGMASLRNNTTGSNITAVGYQAGYSNTTANSSAFFGWQAGYSNTTAENVTFIGFYAGQASTGAANTFIGSGSGYLVTSGAKNTILGAYNGNQGGLDIRTSSNNIVLSDGDGTPQFVVNGSSQAGLFGQPFSGWDSARYRSLQFGNGASARYFSIAQQYTAACSGSLLWNAYGDGDNTFKYAVTGDKASRMALASDYFAFYGAATGTAGNAISWSTILGGQKDYTISLQDASSSSGTGIAFPATQNASSNANTLDDYEEGTWTPSIVFSSGSATYATQSGSYVKVGRLITVSAIIVLLNKSTASGNVAVDLPFNSQGASPVNYWTISYASNFITLGAGAYEISGQLGGTVTNRLNFYNQISGGTKTTLDASQLANNSEIIFTISYQTNA